ncbi:MAG: hypothetical protein RCG15_01770 [Candidatus Rickettsia vulgarisii]
MTIIYYEEVEKVRGPPEVEFRSYKVSSKKEAISKITDEYFSKNSLNIVVANSSITGPLIGMELLVNIEKFIIILDQINEELHRQWLLAAEKFPEKILLADIDNIDSDNSSRDNSGNESTASQALSHVLDDQSWLDNSLYYYNEESDKENRAPRDDEESLLSGSDRDME